MGYTVAADREAAYAFCTEFFALGRTDGYQGLVQLKDGETIAAVVYDHFNGTNIFMHVAARPGRKWLNRHFLHETFKHPFITLGCRRVSAWIDRSNQDSRRFCAHLGFQVEGVMKGAAEDGGDVELYRLFREECRYA
jgi:RimJ/RimL family protein N-acetyltransferase